MTECVIRRLLPEDAPGVRSLALAVWGENYGHPEVYDPEALLRLNREGRVISLVAVTDVGVVVAHDALERPDLGVVAETGMAMTHPDHRGAGIISKTRARLVELAGEMKLQAVFGTPVTFHAHTQKIYESLGFHCVGALPGLLPAKIVPTEFKTQAAPGRISTLLYFRLLQRQAPRLIFPPERHAEAILGFYERLGIPMAEKQEDVQVSSLLQWGEEIETRDSAEMGIRHLLVRDARKISADWLESWIDDRDVEVLIVDLPLEARECPALCRVLEEFGFFFAGILPCALAGRDAIRHMRLKDRDFFKVITIINADAQVVFNEVVGGIP